MRLVRLRGYSSQLETWTKNGGFGVGFQDFIVVTCFVLSHLNAFDGGIRGWFPKDQFSGHPNNWEQDGRSE